MSVLRADTRWDAGFDVLNRLEELARGEGSDADGEEAADEEAADRRNREELRLRAQLLDREEQDGFEPDDDDEEDDALGTTEYDVVRPQCLVGLRNLLSYRNPVCFGFICVDGSKMTRFYCLEAPSKVVYFWVSRCSHELPYPLLCSPDPVPLSHLLAWTHTLVNLWTGTHGGGC